MKVHSLAFADFITSSHFVWFGQTFSYNKNVAPFEVLYRFANQFFCMTSAVYLCSVNSRNSQLYRLLYCVHISFIVFVTQSPETSTHFPSSQARSEIVKYLNFFKVRYCVLKMIIFPHSSKSPLMTKNIGFTSIILTWSNSACVLGFLIFNFSNKQ